jgi:hypothetical protein
LIIINKKGVLMESSSKNKNEFLAIIEQLEKDKNIKKEQIH